MTSLPDFAARAGFLTPPGLHAPYAGPPPVPPRAGVVHVVRAWEESTFNPDGLRVLVQADDEAALVTVAHPTSLMHAAWRQVDVYAEPGTRVAFMQAPARDDRRRPAPPMVVVAVDAAGTVRVASPADVLELLAAPSPSSSPVWERSRITTRTRAAGALARRLAWQATASAALAVAENVTPRLTSVVSDVRPDMMPGATQPVTVCDVQEQRGVAVTSGLLAAEDSLQTWAQRGRAGQEDLLLRLLVIDRSPTQRAQTQRLLNEVRDGLALSPHTCEQLRHEADRRRDALAQTVVTAWEVQLGVVDRLATTVRADGTVVAQSRDRGPVADDRTVQRHAVTAHRARLAGAATAPPLSGSDAPPTIPASPTPTGVTPVTIGSVAVESPAALPAMGGDAAGAPTDVDVESVTAEAVVAMPGDDDETGPPVALPPLRPLARPAVPAPPFVAPITGQPAPGDFDLDFLDEDATPVMEGPPPEWEDSQAPLPIYDDGPPLELPPDDLSPIEDFAVPFVPATPASRPARPTRAGRGRGSR